jgi:uncharacterized protein YyaL (SSP411 family)
MKAPSPSGNQLGDESSPYLLQHQNNPVHWMAWGEDAFALARETGKPVLLSIGYAACHWCHVMAHESFEDDTIAAQMNELFVNIKVDREERPDVDAIYQQALQVLGEQGGWPLTMFLTPGAAPTFRLKIAMDARVFLGFSIVSRKSTRPRPKRWKAIQRRSPTPWSR